MSKPPKPRSAAPQGQKPRSKHATGQSKGAAKGQTKGQAEQTADTAKNGDRIAKVLARAGVASRRMAEALINEGRIAVNGQVIDSPALNVTSRDKIAVDGQPLAAAEPVRVWLYNKPLGLVTSERDEKGRETVFDTLPEDMPRVMSVGRLDLNSEGLLLLTNDGGLKRKLELPSTGWLRKYRVRVKGAPTEAMLAPLKQGVTIDGERFQPMLVTLDRQQGANAWLTVGIREGRNREIRRAMESVGLVVNRLIRTAYGPFQLGELATGAVEELRPSVLRDQLGLSPDEIGLGQNGPKRAAPRAKPKADAAPATRRSHGAKSHGAKPHGTRRPTGGDEDMSTRKPRSWGAKSARDGASPKPTGQRGRDQKSRDWSKKRP